jgi:hypothetical protein
MIKIRNLILVLAIISPFGIAGAVVVPASAEYLFGPETSENEACELARNKAKSLALSQVVGNMLSAGPSSGGGDPVRSGGGNVPQLAEGGIVSRPTLVMAGEGNDSEAILPIRGLMSTIHNAISMNSMNSQMRMGSVPVTVRVQVEGKMRAGEMYLMNKNYNSKLNDLK